MYIAAGEYLKAVEIMGKNGWLDRYGCMYVSARFLVMSWTYKPAVCTLHAFDR